jgi:hypothetical protein
MNAGVASYRMRQSNGPALFANSPARLFGDSSPQEEGVAGGKMSASANGVRRTRIATMIDRLERTDKSENRQDKLAGRRHGGLRTLGMSRDGRRRL